MFLQVSLILFFDFILVTSSYTFIYTNYSKKEAGFTVLVNPASKFL